MKTYLPLLTILCFLYSCNQEEDQVNNGHQQSFYDTSTPQTKKLSVKLAPKALKKAIEKGNLKKVKELCARSDAEKFMHTENFVSQAVQKGNKDILAALLACKGLKEILVFDPQETGYNIDSTGEGRWFLNSMKKPEIFKMLIDSKKLSVTYIDFALRKFIRHKNVIGGTYFSPTEWGDQLKQLLKAKGVANGTRANEDFIKKASGYATKEGDDEFTQWMKDNGF